MVIFVVRALQANVRGSLVKSNCRWLPQNRPRIKWMEDGWPGGQGCLELCPYYESNPGQIACTKSVFTNKQRLKTAENHNTLPCSFVRNKMCFIVILILRRVGNRVCFITCLETRVTITLGRRGRPEGPHQLLAANSGRWSRDLGRRLCPSGRVSELALVRTTTDGR